MHIVELEQSTQLLILHWLQRLAGLGYQPVSQSEHELRDEHDRHLSLYASEYVPDVSAKF